MGALLLASAFAHAQYAWIDEKGVRHYSDQPPPTNTPDAKILKVPRGLANPASTAEPAAPAPTVAEREADYTKRQVQAADSAKKAAAEKQVADARQARCTTAAQNKAKLTGGGRILTDKNTEMSAADRARELATANTILTECK